uniref:TYR_PHOSPHATASE_2 domain-containing protein n=1 Tax=Steinernema glaseri TaxID=37863 RepID=A0A1I7ZD65_9BILA
MPRISSKIPEKWSKYAPIGTVIADTRFICFKTPLCDKLAWSKVRKPQRFNVNDLFRKVAEMNEELGLVIDLTNSDRYYDPGDIEGMMVEYEKLYCPSGGFCDRDDLVETFNNLVESFVTRNLDNKLLIGVHCSDGINRSGYLVCNFLIHKLGWTSHEALNAFEQARGYPIDRGHYVAAVHRATRERKPKKRQRMEELQGIEEEGEAHRDKGEKRKKKKRKKKESDDEGLDESVGTPAESSVVSSFFAMQEQVKKTAAASPLPEGAAAAPGQAYQVSAESSPLIAGEDEDMADEEGDDGSEGTPGQESISQKRRRRRMKKQQMYDTMRRGQFWEINEMLKDQQKAP